MENGEGFGSKTKTNFLYLEEDVNVTEGITQENTQ